jgi:ADP-heptose:LPS heptosyltransferase
MLRALGLGDFLTAIPAFRALARAFPNYLRILAAPVELAPLAHMSGAIDEVAETRPFARVAPELQGADVAVNLHGSGPQSHTLLLETQPKRMIAFACRGVFDAPSLPRWEGNEHEIERWCRMLEAFGIACDRNDLELTPPAKERAAYVVLHPGASSEARRWPMQRWIELARALARRGVPIRITGCASEFRRARTIARAAGIPVGDVLAGKTTLEELAALIGVARAVVCGDTGVAHLATATRTPSVVLFGPMSPQRWGPPRDRPWHRAIWHGSTGDPHAASVDPGLAEIGVAEVLDGLRDAGGLA